MYRVLSVCGFRPLNQSIVEKQTLNSGSEERLKGFARSVNDRLPFDVEARIQNHFATRQFANFLKKRVEVAIIVSGDCLHPSGAVDVRDGWKGLRGAFLERRRS